MDSKYLKKYKERMCQAMMQANPTWKKKDVEKIIERTIEERLENPTVTLDNNYTHEQKDSTLLSVLDWSLDRKPLIAGNGTFYKNQYEALNPTREMLDEWAENRKFFKKKMFQAGEMYGTNSREYNDNDRKQLNEKINMNSYYGGSGAKTSAFYSKWSGPATTLTAQSVISTAEQTFEAFLADNYVFLNLTELIEWIRSILKKDFYLDDFIVRVKRQDVIEHLLSRILNKEENDEEILQNYLTDCTIDELTFLYYKNNMIAFIENHNPVKDMIIDILEKVENYDHVDEKDPQWLRYIPSKHYDEFKNQSAKKWNKFVNKEMFMDPNSPPDSIIKELDVLSECIIKYVYTEYLSFDRIYRLKNFFRNTVTVIDTDSNFLSLDILMNYLLNSVIEPDGYGRSQRHNEFILINTITFIITKIIRITLDFYGKQSNIPEEYRGRFDMKNEFFDELLVIAEKKKRYITKQTLREGNYNDPPKIDTKGFDFKKATTSEYAEKVFNQLIKDYVVTPEHVDVKSLINGLRAFKKEIITSIRNGERKFLPNGNAKEFGAYKEPGREQSVRGVLTWNYLYPDNQIELPAKISLVKMNIFSEEDMEDLERAYPEIYQTIIDKIFNDTTGFFVTSTFIPPITYVNPKKKEWYSDIPKKYQTKFKKLGPFEWNKWVDKVMDHEVKVADKEREGYYEYKKRGLQVLAIPSNAKIPDWAMPYIDYDTMVNTIIAPFKPVLEIFNAKFPEIGKTRNGVNRKTATVSNIIKF